MYQKVLWSIGQQSLLGAVVIRTTSSGRNKVSIQFEDGRWFEGVPERALHLNVNWTLLDETVSSEELYLWSNKSEFLTRYIYSVGVEMVVPIEWPFKVKRNRRVLMIATVEAKNSDDAKDAAVLHFLEKGTDVVAKYVKLSGCQISGFNQHIIEAS